MTHDIELSVADSIEKCAISLCLIRDRSLIQGPKIIQHLQRRDAPMISINSNFCFMLNHPVAPHDFLYTFSLLFSFSVYINGWELIPEVDYRLRYMF